MMYKHFKYLLAYLELMFNALVRRRTSLGHCAVKGITQRALLLRLGIIDKILGARFPVPECLIPCLLYI